MAGAGVPLRLSATEAEDDDDEEFARRDGSGSAVSQHDDWGMDASFYGSGGRGSDVHRRTGSGRSSLGSRSNTLGDRFSAGGVDNTSPVAGHGRNMSVDYGMLRLDERTPLASQFNGLHQSDYFNPERKGTEDASSPEDDAERERREDELRRRGSVDDRAMTMSGVRLFVANPDLDD
jgi:hypothetical protein